MMFVHVVEATSTMCEEVRRHTLHVVSQQIIFYYNEISVGVGT